MELTWRRPQSATKGSSLLTALPNLQRLNLNETAVTDEG